MKRVFLGGSRRVSRLNELIRRRVEEIVRRELEVVIGDANGADKALQSELAARHYPHVRVYFVGARPRNNIGAWPTCRIPTPRGVRGFDFYAVKDRAMAAEAEAGLMLWDGQSRGTFENVTALAEAGKPVAVYVANKRRFVNVVSQSDLRTLAAEHSKSIDAEAASATAPVQQESLEIGLEARTRSSVSRRK